MQKEKILVIDDDPYIKNACSEYLTSVGYVTVTASSGEEGIELVQNNVFSLVMTDYKMPGMDGLEVLKKIKEISPKTDVIILTAHGTIENAVEAMRQGAYDYLTKDFNIEELDLIVGRCIEKQRLTAEVSELKEVVSIYKASKAINSLMGFDELLNLILKLSCESVSADGGSLMLYDKESGSMVVRATAGISEDSGLQKTLNIQTLMSLTETIEEYFSKVTLIRDDKRFLSGLGTDSIISVVTVPLQRKGTLYGLINLFRKSSQKHIQHEELLLSIFASEAVNAIDNLYLYNSLKHEKEELNAIFSNMADGAIALKPDMSILKMNAAACNIFGLNASAVEGKNVISVLEEFTSDVNLAGIKDSKKRIQKFELYRIIGKSLFLDVISTEIKDGNEPTAGFIWVVRDITQEKREGKHQNDFLSLISHKLKTPLTTIIGYSLLLLDTLPEINDRSKGALKSINKQGELLDELVNNLVRFTMIDSDIQLEQTNGSLFSLIELSTNKLVELSSENNVQLIIDPSVKAVPQIYADRKKMVDVFDCLVKNAVKFNNKEKKEIKITASNIDNMVTIEITDNGVGIPPEEYSNIFKKFYQIDEYSTGQIKGMGLGLALVKRIIESHGGKVWVKSSIGIGSTFSFTLPLAK